MKYRKSILWSIVFLFILVGCVMSRTTSYAKTKQYITVDMQAKSTPRKSLQAVFDEIGENNKTNSNILYVVTIPRGTYEINGVLRVFSNTYVKMKGVTLKRTSAKSMLHLGEDADAFNGYNGYHDITFEGGTWDGNGKEHSKYDVSIVRLGHGKKITFKGVTFTNVVEAHHLEMAACRDVVFDKCTFSNFVGKSDGNVEALQIDIMRKSHFPKYDKYDDTPCKNITIKNCKFYNLQRGMGTHSGVAGSYHENITISNNVFENIQGYAIRGTNYRKAKIKNNKINNVGAGIMLCNMSTSRENFYKPLSGKPKIKNNSYSSITGNTITVTDKKYDAAGYGIAVYGDILLKKTNGIPKGNYSIKQVKVSDNVITMKNKEYGIWLYRANNSTISNNKITMSIPGNASGIYYGNAVHMVAGSGITIKNNSMTFTSKNKKSKYSCGIVILSYSNATITDNVINNSCRDGIRVAYGSYATIRNNTLKKPGRYAVYVYKKSQAHCKGNKFYKVSKKKRMKKDKGSKIKK